MSKVFIGSIINGFKILKKIFNSFIPERSIYKTKCTTCGEIYKLRFMDIKNKICKCKKEIIEEPEIIINEKRRFNKDMKKNIGIHRGKYIVVGYLTHNDLNPSPSMKHKSKLYIVKCLLCGELCIMNNNNLNSFREKRDINSRCNHKLFFDLSKFDTEDFYIDWELVNKE